MQALLQQLRPTALENVGLIESLRMQCQALGYRTGAEVTAELGDLPPDELLPIGAQEMVFRIVQEGFANIARHARASHVWLSLRRQRDALLVEIGAPQYQDKSSLFPVPSSGEILHYTDSGWAAAKVAEFLQSPLLSVSLDSPQDGWAVGWAGTFVHYNGNVWSTVPGPLNFNQTLLDVAMLSPLDGWAVGYSGSILHYNGKQWIQVQSPARVDLRSIAMPSPQEGWAVGDSGTILHYHHGTWSLVSPSPTNNTLNSVSMLSTSEGWAVGTHGTILHYRDGTWESVHPASYYRDPSIYKSVDFFGVAMNSIRSGWIIGDQHYLTYSLEAWIEPGVNSATFSGTSGKSSDVSSVLVNLYSIAMSPSGEGWAVGGMNGNVTNVVVILHYQSGRWSVFS